MTDTETASPTTTEEGEALAAAGALGRAAAAFRHALDEVHAADDAAWAAYSRSLDDAARRLQAELLVAEAQLDAGRAAHTETVHDAVATAETALQEALDTLRVRAHLGRMDVSSTVTHALADLDHRAVAVRDAARRARSVAATTVDDAARAARVVLTDIVEVLRLVAAFERDVLPPVDDEDPPPQTD